MKRRTGAALGLTVGLTLAGCGPLGLQLDQIFGGAPPKISAPASSSGSSSPDPGTPAFQPATGQIQRLAGGIVSNNASKLAGSVLGPAGIVSNNASKFEIQSSFAQVPIAGAWVWISTTDGYFVADPDGTPYQAQTDAQGNFSFAQPLPAGQEYVLDVFVGAASPWYVLRNFAYTQPGSNNAQIDLASTCASDYLFYRAKTSDPSFAQIDFAKLPAIIGSTRGLLESGSLTVGLDELRQDENSQLLATYGAAVAQDTDLTAQWNALVGPPPASPTPAPAPTFGGSLPEPPQ